MPEPIEKICPLMSNRVRREFQNCLRASCQWWVSEESEEKAPANGCCAVVLKCNELLPIADAE